MDPWSLPNSLLGTKLKFRVLIDDQWFLMYLLRYVEIERTEVDLTVRL